MLCQQNDNVIRISKDNNYYLYITDGEYTAIYKPLHNDGFVDIPMIETNDIINSFLNTDFEKLDQLKSEI